MVGIDQAADRTAAFVVDANVGGLIRYVSVLLHFGIFDAGADVGEGESNFIVFKNDEFFRSVWLRSFNSETSWLVLFGDGNLGDRAYWNGRRFVLSREIDIEGDKSPADGEDYPSFTVVHGVEISWRLERGERPRAA